MKHKKDIPWWLIITMLVIFWPVGMLMLFSKIFGDDDEKKQVGRKNNGYRMDKTFTDVPYRSSDGEIGAKLKPKELKKKFSLRKGKFLRNFGIGLSFLGGIGSMIAFLANMLSYGWLGESLMISSIIFLAIGAPGLGLTLWGQNMYKKARRYSRYARLIGDSSEVSLDRLAGAMGLDFDKVCSDLQKMLDGGYFEGCYVDVERRVLTRGRLGAAAPRQQTRQKAEPAKEAKASEKQHPADRIHAINETIRQPEVSQKITRLEGLTRRIYNYTEAYPEKDKLARSFKELYLPKTIKILESYSRFEASGSSGENVRAAMKDVEAVLDVLITSFEKQLDMLYMDEALDITTDIDALESMIAGDGLGHSPFAMGAGM